jgi:CelD/BcsL family acetyltransferase involved in cellulose biosynthesis
MTDGIKVRTGVAQEKRGTNGSGDLQLQVYESFEDLMRLQPEWDEFIESVGGDILLTYDWCRSWWKYYGTDRSLKVFIFRAGANICGLLPVFFEKIWLGPACARVVKIVGSDYMPVAVTIPVEREHIRLVMDMFLSGITECWNWDILHLGPICGKYDAVDVLLEACERSVAGPHRTELKGNDVQTYFELAENWERQIAGLSQKQRGKAKKAWKELRQRDISVRSAFASKDSLGQMFDNFVRMHQNHWQKLGMSGHFVDWPAAYEFHREMANIQFDRDRLRLLEIKFNDQCVGYDYMYKLGDTYCWFLNARTESTDSGRVDFKWIAFAERMEKALSDNVKCFDAMRGTYEYKALMGGTALPIRNVFVCSNRPSQRARIWVFRILVQLFDIAYSKVWRARVAGKLGIRPGPFWHVWIKTRMFSR